MDMRTKRVLFGCGISYLAYGLTCEGIHWWMICVLGSLMIGIGAYGWRD